MLKHLLIFFLIVFASTFTKAQALLTWQDFADVNFEAEFNENYGVDFLMPNFGETIKFYQGKQVSITGYFLDISGNGEVLLISRNPMAACFFCGGAGPETIIEVNFKTKPPFRTDQVVEVIGLLELNADDVDHCNYILNQATGRLVN